VNLLFLRALLAFFVLPGVVGGLLPWLIVAADRRRGPGWPVLGGIIAAIGLAVVLRCVRDFYVAGKGTLAPWDPPRHLVVVGLYRYTRNPMYVGVLTFVLGWSLAAGSWRLAAYCAALAVSFHLRTIWYEEPRLAALFGLDWQRYHAAVPRWLPRRQAWRA
jgi:protein-S-isoprenylcysteine O-methyltransferase Ste14